MTALNRERGPMCLALPRKSERCMRRHLGLSLRVADEAMTMARSSSSCAQCRRDPKQRTTPLGVRPPGRRLLPASASVHSEVILPAAFSPDGGASLRSGEGRAAAIIKNPAPYRPASASCRRYRAEPSATRTRNRLTLIPVNRRPQVRPLCPSMTEVVIALRTQ